MDIEAIISRVRGAVILGMSLEEALIHFGDIPSEQVFLSYHAALILEGDVQDRFEDTTINEF